MEKKSRNRSQKLQDEMTNRVGQYLAERVGFEPTVHFSAHTHLAGEHLQPLGHLSVVDISGGGGSRIRTHGAFRHSGFQDRRLKPLGHPSGKFH